SLCGHVRATTSGPGPAEVRNHRDLYASAEELGGPPRARAAEAGDLDRRLPAVKLALLRLGDDRPVEDDDEGVRDPAAGARQRRLRVEADEARVTAGREGQDDAPSDAPVARLRRGD